MATEADLPEGLESVSVMKIKEETKELECSHLDTMVSKASSLGELQKAGNGHCSLTSETVEKSINTEDSDVVSQNFNNNVNNHILEGKLGSTEGETFSKSTAVATGASDESMQGSEIEDREKLALVQKEDAMTNKDVEEAHDIIAMNNILALDEHDTSMNLENFEDGKEIHSSKLPSEVNTMEISTAENYLSIPNITSTSLDQSVQEENFEGREGETIVEEEKQTSEESSDDRRMLLEETDKEDIRLHQHVESSTAESYEQTSAIAEEVAAVSQKDESEGKTEDPSFELREQVGQTVEATLDHSESLKKLKVSKEESTGLVILTNDEDREQNCDSGNIPIKQDVVYGDVTQTNEQEETILLKAEPEEKDKQECASSQALKDIKEAEKPCQEEVPIRHETADANEYTDKQIIQEEVATKYQPFTVSYEEEIVQSCQADEEVEMKQDTEVPVGIEVDRATKNSTEKVIAEKEAVEEHAEASSTGAEKVPMDNQEQEKEANKPEEEDSTRTQMIIAVEDIQEDTFENNDGVTDHCIESDREKSTNMNSHEDLELPEELEADEARKNIAELITEETEAVEDYSEPSTREENQEDENETKESKKEDCSGTQTIIAYEDTQEYAFDNNNAANGHCRESEGEATINVEENPGEDPTGNMPGVEVFGGLGTVADTTASENTSKQFLKDEVAKSPLPVSIGEETTKAIYTKDEARENNEGAEDGTTTAEQNVQEDTIATELPAISILEKIIRNSCQEDEACTKEPETSGTNDVAVKEYVEADGAITDISVMAIGEGTTVEDSHEEEKKAKPEGKDKECDSNRASDRDLVNLDNEDEPNSNPIGYVDTEVSEEEIQKNWNEKLVVSSLASEVCDEHIGKEIAVKHESNDDGLNANVSENLNMSFNEAGPEGVRLIDTSDLPSAETSPVPIEANETSLEAPHVEELKPGENSILDEKADKEILDKENADENRARDEIKYYMTHGARNVLVPEYKDYGAEPIPETEAASVEIPPTIESETLQEASILPSGQLDLESTEANMTIEDDTPTEDHIQDEVQKTPPIERPIEESFMQKDDSIEEAIDVQEKNLEIIQLEEMICKERTVEDEILKPRDEEVLQKNLQKDESELYKQETCVDQMSKGLDSVDSSANDEKDTSDKVEQGEENLKESVEEDIQNGELSGIYQTRNQNALQEEERNLVDLASMQQNLIQNGETDTLLKDADDTSVSNLRPKENDHREAQSIEATEEIKSTEHETLHHEKADGLVESVERECGKLEPIVPAEKVRDASETTAEDQNVVTSTETKEGQTAMDQYTGSVENHIIVQNTEEEDTEAEIYGETRPRLKTEKTDPHGHFDAEKEVQGADKSEEIENQITEKDVAVELYLLSTSDEAVNKVQDTDIVGNKQNLEVKESNEKKELATVQDEENPNSKPEAASMTEESEEEKPKKVVDDELSETFTLVSELVKENNQETTEDLPGITETESAFIATEEKCSQPVESECEKIVLPTDICSDEKTLEPVETLDPTLKDEVGSVNLEEKSELMSGPPSTLISETHEENCEETTEETSLQKVDPEGEKSVLPSGMGTVEKSPEIIETETILVDEDINSVKFEEKSELISQFSSTGDGNGTQEKSIENLDRNKLEEEIKEVVPASDVLSESEDQSEEAICQLDNAAEKTKENLHEFSPLVSETQELGTLKDNQTVIDASEVKHNPEIESTVCQNVEVHKEDAQEIQLTAVDEVLKYEDQMEYETQDKNVDNFAATSVTEGTHPRNEEECKELEESPIEFEDVNETPNVESMKEAEKLDISPGLVLDSEEPTEQTEPLVGENLKEGQTSESEVWKKKSENNELVVCFLRVEEETETVGASEDPHKDVTDNNVQVKNQEENSTEECRDDTTMSANPNEENTEIQVNLGEKSGSLKVKNTIHNEDDSSKMNSSVEDKLVGEVGGECNEASNSELEIPQKTLELVFEAQTRDVVLETTRNDEDAKDMVPVGHGNIGEISLVETTGKEHLKEENQIKERGENEYLNREIAQEVCARLENSGTSESREKQIKGEEGCDEEPFPISVGKDTVTESRQEAHTGEPFMETHMKLEPAESGFEPIAGQLASSNEAIEITKNGTLIEENQGLENSNANENTEMLITKEEEASKIILEETNKEMTVSSETREKVPAKNEEGPDMNLHERHITSAPCVAETTENMYAMVVESSSLELEDATATNSETTISATEDARALNSLAEDGSLFSTPLELVSKHIETTEAFLPNDQNVATMIDASVADEVLPDDIPDKEERAKEHEGEHIESQAITAVCPPPEEVEHVKNDAPEKNILKEGVKKLEEFNIHEKSREIQIPQQEGTQVFLAAAQETAEESGKATTGKINNASESFVEDESRMKTDPTHEAKACESETTESSKPEDIEKPGPEGLSADQPSVMETIGKEITAKPGPEGLSADQPSVMETLEKETTVNLEECYEISQNFEKISEVGEKTNEEERSTEEYLSKATEAKTPTLQENQNGSTLEKNNIEEQKPREISEINGKTKEEEEECGQYKESISKTEPSKPDLTLDSERETSFDEKEPLESKVPLTVQVEKDAKEEEKHSADEEEDEHIKEDSGSDAPVMVEASADVDVKPAHKKSHNILSGVGSKVKHSIAKVKKAITGKSSSHKSSSPKQENGPAATA